MKRKLLLDQIEVGAGTQLRSKINWDAVAEYAEMIKSMPPMDVFFDGEKYWLADGFHRFYAYRKLDLNECLCQIHKGTLRDAILFSCGANDQHGVRRTVIDRRKAVETLLKDEEWAKWSNAEIARRCNVSDDLVAEIRKAHHSETKDVRLVRRGESVYPQDTSNIGRQKSAPESSPTPEPEEDKDKSAPRPQSYKDNRGDTVPRKLGLVFEESDEFDEYAAHIAKVRDGIKWAREEKDKKYGHLDCADVENRLTAIRNEINAAKPYARCPKCEGKGCASCKTLGFVGHPLWLRLTAGTEA